MQMKPTQAEEMTLGAALLRRLDAIDSTLRRICLEKDLLLAAVRDLLLDRGLHASATKLTEAVEQLYQERAAAAAEMLERQERDTEPPGAP